LADAKVLAGAFLSSLGQAAVSPWMLIVLAVTLAMGGISLHLRRRSRTVPLLALPPAADPPDPIEGCGPGRHLLAYPSRACPASAWIAAQMEAGDDVIAECGGTSDAEISRHMAEWERQRGDGRG